MRMLTLLVATLWIAAPVAAQPDARDARWQPWLGCWELVTERAQMSGGAPAARQPALPGTRVCVAPAPEGPGVTLTTWIGEAHVMDSTITATGEDRTVTDDSCRGTERTTWSRNGDRLFTSAEITCADQAPRRVSGLGLLTPDALWLDIQVIDIGGRKNVRVRRYGRVDDPRAHPSASPLSWRGTGHVGTAFSLDDVMEASAAVLPEAVQAALVELDAAYDLDSRRLVALDEAGVAGRVIDLMIALSYPERFVVDRPSGGGPAGGMDARGLWPWLQDTGFWSSYYVPFGYHYWGYYDPYRYPSSGFVVVQPVEPDALAPSGRGRVVKDFGYTQVRPRQVEPAVTAGGGSRGGSTTSSTSGASGGGVSGQGYSGGGTSTGTTRTAQPRPPGGR
ncbi:MAG: hypothetical protein Q8L86_15765 [Vicinamibacterales bacterium]|nr:hypothetical protein [Vicinamibacterales bacterium]